MNREHRIRVLPLAIALGLLVTAPLHAQDNEHRDQQRTQMDADRSGNNRAYQENSDRRNTGQNDRQRSDTTLEQRIWSKYALESTLNPYQITVEVQGNRAILRGEVEQFNERQLAERLAKDVEGITAVDNQIVVVSRVAGNERNRRDTTRMDQRDQTAQQQQFNRDRTTMQERDIAEQRTRDERTMADRDTMARRDNDEQRGFGQVMSDASVTAAVKSRLLWNRNTGGLAIDVDTRNGHVQLNGEVENEMARTTAERLARDTDGVASVTNNLRVDPDRVAQRTTDRGESNQPVNDAWITAKVKSSLLYSAQVDGTDFNVETENGRVRLSGTVTDRNELTHAIEIARDIRGVVDVDASDVRVQS